LKSFGCVEKKVLFRFQELLPEIVEFLQVRSDLRPQLKFSVVAVLTDLTAKLNELNTELQGGNKTTIRIIGTIESSQRKLKLWKTQLTKDVLTHFPSVYSLADVTLDASVYILINC
jgi:hypothetical protein